jgi:prepilin peptidase CpaA
VPSPHWWIAAALLTLLSVAAWTDLKWRRIPNWLTATVVVAGFAQSLVAVGWSTPFWAFCGMILGFVLTFLMYAVGGRGAGDVKLMAGIGAWLGPLATWWVFALAAIVSLIVALVQAAIQGKLRNLLNNAALMLLNTFHVKQLGAEHVIDTGRRTRSIDNPMPNAVHVWIATIAWLMFVYWRGSVLK